MSEAPQQPETAESVGAVGPYYRLRVLAVIDETRDARSFELEVPADAADRFDYRAGQFLTFRLVVGEERLVRCYSLASTPDVDPAHKFTVKRIDEGRASNWINDHVDVGDWLEVMPPAGVFCLGERVTPLVLFGAGSGITPVISILKSALAATERSVRLLYANRDRDSVIFRDELLGLEQQYSGRLEVIHRLDSESGFVDRESIAQVVAGREDADFYICGPGPFMDTAEAALESLEVDPSQIFIERFVSLSGGGDSVESSPEVGAGQEALLDPGDGNPPTLTITLDGKTCEVPYTPGQTLLAAARAAGLEPPFACEEGYCSCCMAKLTRGRARMLTNDALAEDQVEEGWVLTCQSVPLEDEITVEYPD